MLKSILATSLALALSLTLSLAAQSFTTPTGYVRHTVQTGFNYLGLTLHGKQVASGTIGAPSGTTLPSSVTDLTVALGTPDADSLVIIEITGGDNDGLLIEASSWSGSNFTNIAGLASISNLEGDTFLVRHAASLADLFGADNSAGFLEGTLETADIIWASNGDGSFSRYYYSPGDPAAFPVPIAEGWKNAIGQNIPDTKINYLDGFFIQRRGSTPLIITILGEVKTNNAIIPINGESFNYLSSLYPIGVTLNDTELSEHIQHGDLDTGDIVWMPNGPNLWDRYYYTDADPAAFPIPVTEGWKTATGADASTKELTSGFILQRRSSTPLNTAFRPSSLYDNL